MPPTTPATTPATIRAAEFARHRRADAEDLGRRLADEVGDPGTFADVLRTGLTRLADPGSRAGQRRVAPGIDSLHGVPRALIEGVQRAFRVATRGERTSSWLFVVDRLLREPELEARWFAFALLERLVVDDTERAWQLLRRAAREAGDRLTVDSLARPIGQGILNEEYRWAELEQLVYSPSRWERRLVGSTIATIPFIDRSRGRTAPVAGHGLGLVGELIGDAEPDVQNALARALRSMARVDRRATTRFLDAEALLTADAADGHRARVIRDALGTLDPGDAGRIRARVAGIRAPTGAPATSRASQTAERFGAGLRSQPMAEHRLS
ncbi:MAG TPA: DNA alkylation repair protein [Patescibacteria group bacterium]|nr:DNA alkylation repair protein [Patescibacteria group bacterium]